MWAQNNLWGLYREYLWKLKLGNNVENIWVICGNYLWGLFEYFVIGERVNKDFRCDNSSS